MEAESFFARWEKRNAEKREAEAAAQQAAPPAAEEPPKPPPTLEDVAALNTDSDFKPFVARGVDEEVRRSAMKKLFADPQFNVMDGLDVYIEDYNTYVPIPAQVLGALNHAQALLDPLRQLQHPVMRLIDSVAAAAEAAPEKDEDGAGEEAGDRIEQQEPPQADDGDAAQAPPQMEGQQDDDHPI